MMIDAHAHVISGDKVRYVPASPSGEIAPADFDKPMDVEFLLREMDAAGVDKAVLVQRGSIYGFDNSYVCDSAARFPERLRAVGSIDPTRSDCAQQVERLAREGSAAGIRLMELVRGQGMGWLDSPGARGAWAAAAQLQVPVCVHFFPWNRAEGLARLRAILGDIAGLTVVIDHFAAIRAEAGPPDHGVDELLEGVAGFEGVTVKFTTIPLGRLHHAGIDARPLVHRVRDLFGAERMMWGSDITQSPGTYGYMADLGREAVGGLSTGEQEQLLGGTAARVYSMD
ncbi:MAG TPA: amidohydrolase family protein [Croceibacterium sp.]|nr:amidohydrolase family protein [Croceibacterium sp.]